MSAASIPASTDGELVAFMIFCAEAHIAWADWFEANPEKEATYVATGEWDSAKDHRTIADNYYRMANRFEEIRHDAQGH